MRKRTGMAALLTLAALLAAPAAAAETYGVDLVHSSVVFRVRHMDVSYSYGRFNKFSGSFTLDEADPGKSRFEFEVDVDSIDTANEKRDLHLKSPDFFNATEFPTIKFTSKSVKRSGDALEVTGDLTLHGKTREITVKIDVTGRIDHPKLGKRAGIESVFTVKRSDFGMPVEPRQLGDEVRLMVSIEGIAR